MTQKNIFCKFLGLLENRLMIYIVSIIMMTTFYAVFEVTGSLFVKSIFDIAEKGNYEDVSVTMGFYLLIGIVAVCIASMFMYIYNNEAKKGSIEIKKKVFSKTLNFPMEFYDTHHSGELLSRLIYDTDKASNIFIQTKESVGSYNFRFGIYNNNVYNQSGNDISSCSFEYFTFFT